MKKLVGIMAVGIGAALFAGDSPVQAQQLRAETFSRGVTMKCSAVTKGCRFNNVRPKGRFCTWSVSYVAVSPRHGRQRLTKSGNVFVAGGARQHSTFHFGRADVRRLDSVSLNCRFRRHY